MVKHSLVFSLPIVTAEWINEFLLTSQLSYRGRRSSWGPVIGRNSARKLANSLYFTMGVLFDEQLDNEEFLKNYYLQAY